MSNASEIGISTKEVKNETNRMCWIKLFMSHGIVLWKILNSDLVGCASTRCFVSSNVPTIIQSIITYYYWIDQLIETSRSRRVEKICQNIVHVGHYVTEWAATWEANSKRIRAANRRRRRRRDASRTKRDHRFLLHFMSYAVRVEAHCSSCRNGIIDWVRQLPFMIIVLFIYPSSFSTFRILGDYDARRN